MRFIAKVPMKKDMKIAVLIDAENISHKYAHTILQEASSLGNVIYKRIYGNWMSTQLGPWKKELLDHAIQPIQQFSNTTGKNSSDSALIIDAMDLLYQNDLDAFCIVSSDSDFTRLATRLRESDIFVLGRRHRALSSQPAINSCISMFSKRATSARRASRTLARANVRTLHPNGPSKTRQAPLTHPIVANRCALSAWTLQALQAKAARMRLFCPWKRKQKNQQSIAMEPTSST